MVGFTQNQSVLQYCRRVRFRDGRSGSHSDVGSWKISAEYFVDGLQVGLAELQSSGFGVVLQYIAVSRLFKKKKEKLAFKQKSQNTSIFIFVFNFFESFSYAFSNRLSVAILRLPNGLDLSVDVEIDTTPPNGLTTPSNSFPNFNNLENGIASTNLRKDLLQSQGPNGAAATIMHADSYLNIYKIPSGTTPATTPPVGKRVYSLLNINRNYYLIVKFVNFSL